MTAMTLYPTHCLSCRPCALGKILALQVLPKIRTTSCRLTIQKTTTFKTDIRGTDIQRSNYHYIVSGNTIQCNVSQDQNNSLVFSFNFTNLQYFYVSHAQILKNVAPYRDTMVYIIFRKVPFDRPIYL